MNIVKEKYDPESVDIDIYLPEMQDELDVRLWDRNNVLNPNIAKRLLKIATDFMSGLGLENIQIADIIVTGSLANYNWSAYSDIDLHIVVNYSDVDENFDLVKDFFNAVKSLWNRKHNVKIFDYDVEIYVQDADEKHVSTGIYSVLFNRWNIEATRERSTNIDLDNVKIKVASFVDQTDRAEHLFQEGNFDDAYVSAKYLKERIARMRQSGLAKGGQYSVENLAFKILRRSGYIGKLITIRTDAYDKINSIEDAENVSATAFSAHIKGTPGINESDIDISAGTLKESKKVRITVKKSGRTFK
jgi:predicted nucleotidyltransferase